MTAPLPGKAPRHHSVAEGLLEGSAADPAIRVGTLKVVYSPDMVSDTGRLFSPSASKPRVVASALEAAGWPVEIVSPEPLDIESLYRVHAPEFVDGVFSLERNNGFGSRSESVARSLPYTCGAFHTSALIALTEGVSASLTSGFHHAFPANARSYCTFNGLMASAVRLLDTGRADRVAIVDCDFHYGDGTQAIIDELGLEEEILHLSFGKNYRHLNQAQQYLSAMRGLRGRLAGFRPSIILYQAGADTHVDDPLGGLLTTEEMRLRDQLMFNIARELGFPITWNLAGGYQMEPDGTIPRVIELHLNTFAEALRIYGFTPR